MSVRRSHRGSTLLLTMIFLVLFATMATAFHAAANMSLQGAASQRSTRQAQLAAESGLAHMLALVRAAGVSGSAGAADQLLALANHLAATMDGTPNAGAGEVTFDGVTLRTPSITFGSDGESYRAEMAVVNASAIGVTVHGTAGRATRAVYIELSPHGRRSGIFDFGVASRSKIIMTGNPRILGANDPNEASILSATYSDPEAVRLVGNCRIDGSVSTSNPASHVSVTGNPRIGGETDWDAMQQHIHIGVGHVEFPEVDPTVFEPFATNIVDGSTSTNGNRTFENIRIRAGTNPTFAGNITIRGVVFIEQPNQVTFTGNLNFTGVIVTEDAGENTYDQNYIRFLGNMGCQGVESLPNQPQFDGLRDMPGSMLLAPGFGAHFTGNFHTMNGTIAADRFTFTGNASGTVHGSVICYSDSDFTLSGNSNLTIDRSLYQGEPPGFHRTYVLWPDAGTYMEL